MVRHCCLRLQRSQQKKNIVVVLCVDVSQVVLSSDRCTSISAMPLSVLYAVFVPASSCAFTLDGRTLGRGMWLF